MTVDVAAAMAKRGFTELTDEDLRGQGIEAVKCRACSGYGNCGYKTFRLHKGDPYSVCNLRFQKLQEDDAAGDAGAVATPAGDAGAATSAGAPDATER